MTPRARERPRGRTRRTAASLVAFACVLAAAVALAAGPPAAGGPPGGRGGRVPELLRDQRAPRRLDRRRAAPDVRRVRPRRADLRLDRRGHRLARRRPTLGPAPPPRSRGP